MSKSLKRVRAALENHSIPTDILEMPGETRTAADAAREANCEVDQIAKSIIFRGAKSAQAILFITAGGRQVSPVTATELAEEPLERADANFVRSQTGFAIGGVAPIGHLNEPVVFLDETLMKFELVYAAAGTPKHIFAINPQTLAQISNAQVSVFSS